MKTLLPRRGYTLIELLVAVSIFALIMVLAAGTYLMMIGINRHVQGISTGIDNLSFALESMTRSIRTGSGYSCGGGDCPNGSGSFTFVNQGGTSVTYSLAGGAIYRTIGGAASAITDPSVTVTSLTFYVRGTASPPVDYTQPYVTMVITGTTSAGPGKTEPFAVETSASMRGTDL